MVKVIRLVCVLGMWACMIYAAAAYGLKAGAVVALAMMLQAIEMAGHLYDEETPEDDSCEKIKTLLNNMEDDGK